eukprot:1659307-Amphidinium_carterae.1
MDEFWLFMLAKRTEDIADQFHPQAIVDIAMRYAVRNLEDDQFFEALAKQVVDRHDQFSMLQLADFLHACAKLHYLDDALCNVVLSQFQDPEL